jgi:hypothetical protein
MAIIADRISANKEIVGGEVGDCYNMASLGIHNH